MTRTPEQAATVAAWLNILDHCEAQLQALGALPRGRALVREASEIVKRDAAARDRRILRARKSRETIEGLQREVSRLSSEVHRRQDVSKHNEERRLELVALAQELGCDCVPHKMLEAVKALQDAALKVNAARKVKQ